MPRFYLQKKVGNKWTTLHTHALHSKADAKHHINDLKALGTKETIRIQKLHI